MLTKSSGVCTICPGGRALAENFYHEAGLLTTSKTFSGVCLGEGEGGKGDVGAWN